MKEYVKIGDYFTRNGKIYQMVRCDDGDHCKHCDMKSDCRTSERCHDYQRRDMKNTYCRLVEAEELNAAEDAI